MRKRFKYSICRKQLYSLRFFHAHGSHIYPPCCEHCLYTRHTHKWLNQYVDNCGTWDIQQLIDHKHFSFLKCTSSHHTPHSYSLLTNRCSVCGAKSHCSQRSRHPNRPSQLDGCLLGRAATYRGTKQCHMCRGTEWCLPNASVQIPRVCCNNQGCVGNSSSQGWVILSGKHLKKGTHQRSEIVQAGLS